MSTNRELTKSRSSQILALVNNQLLRAYTAYINHVTKQTPPVENLLTDLRDGLALVTFVQNITGKKIERVKPKPVGEIQQRDNLNIVLHAMQAAGLPTIEVQEFFDANQKKILVFFQKLVKTHLFRDQQVHSSSFSRWLNRHLNRQVEVVKEIKEAVFWKDLFNAIRPGTVEEGAIGRDNVGNLSYIFEQVEIVLEIPQLIDADVAADGVVDDEVLSMYLAYCALADESLCEEDELLFLKEPLLDVLKPSPSKTARVLSRSRPKTTVFTSTSLSGSFREGGLFRPENSDMTFEFNDFEKSQEAFKSIEEASVELGRSREDNERLKLTIADQKDQIAELLKARNQAKGELERLEEELAAAKKDAAERDEHEKADRQKESQERERLEGEKKELQEKLDAAKAKKKERKAELKALRKETSQVREHAEKITAEAEMKINTTKAKYEAQLMESKTSNEQINEEAKRTKELLERLTKEKDELAEQKAWFESERNRLDSEAAEMKAVSGKEKEEIIAMRETLHEKDARIMELERQYKMKEEELERRQAEVVEKETEVSGLRQSIREYEEGKETGDERMKILTSEMEAMERQKKEDIAALEKKVEEMQQQISVLEEEKEASGKKVEEMEEVKREMEKEKEEMEKRCEETQAAKEKAEHEREAVQQEKEALEGKVAELEGEQESRLEKIKTLEEEMRRKEETMKQMEEEKKEIERREREMKEEVEKEKEEHETTRREKEERERELEEENEKMKLEMETMRVEFVREQEEQQQRVEQEKTTTKVAEDDLKTMFFNVALSIKLMANSSKANSCNLIDLYDEMKAANIQTKDWVMWLTNKLF